MYFSRRIIIGFIACSVLYLTQLTGLLTAPSTVQALDTPPERPFSLPFRSGPSTATWLFEQPFGNTADAWNFGKYWYRAGQGLHFGLDFEAPCGTEIVAAADGIVDFVDNPLFGALPHTAVIRHEALGYVTVYGHLRDRPILTRGQPIKRGDPIGVAGDPDYTCESRPHLHFEIRNLSYNTAYNPIKLIDADWDRLYSLHQPDWGGFTQDLYAARRWQTLLDQPDVYFNGRIVNSFPSGWMPTYRLQMPTLTLPAFDAPALSDSEPSAARLGDPGCCSRAWFTDPTHIRYIDGNSGDLAGVFERKIDNPNMIRRIEDAPPSTVAPNGLYRLERSSIGTILVLPHSGSTRQIPIPARGSSPQFSPDSTSLLWHVRPGDDIPGETQPRTEIWIARIPAEGQDLDPILVRTQSGGSVRWLDQDRLLLITVAPRTNNATLTIYDIPRATFTELAKVRFMRSLSVAPGGQYLMFTLQFQQNAPDNQDAATALPVYTNGVQLLKTTPGATPVRLPFFGGWRWRDSHSVIYIPFGATKMQFRLYDILSGADRALTTPDRTPFIVSAGDWSIAPDGMTILYREARDLALYTVSLN